MREWNDSGMTNNERERERERENLVLITTSEKQGRRHEGLARILGPDRRTHNL